MTRRYEEFAVGSLFAAVLMTAGASSGTHDAHQRQADNSRQNSLLIRAAAPTAQNQPNDRIDRLTAAHLRRTIVSDNALSAYAHNVKIIVVSGKVTLEGPVHSRAEHEILLADATSIVDAGSVVDRITIPAE